VFGLYENNFIYRGSPTREKNPQVPPQAGWDVKRKVPPKAHGPPIEAFILDDSSPIPCVEDYLIDTVYPVEAYL
jgi:hypothetical protein